MNVSFVRVALGDIKPGGWIKDLMHNDLIHGFVGTLDTLVPQCFAYDDIYGKNRLGRIAHHKNLGVADPDVEGTLQLQWWNSETQSNWYDGFVRTVLMLEQKEYMEKVEAYIDRMLSYQDNDGYMGIYQENCRYNFDFEAGELWAQSTLFRVLLAYYEFTKQERVLQAVVRAMERTMTAYAPGTSTPFLFEQTHGLTITDALETLWRWTKQQKMIDYAVWLYEDFSTHPVNEHDAQLDKLLQRTIRFSCHGVHTYSHLRAIIIASASGKDPKYDAALAAYLDKLDRCISPSGGPIGDEWITNNDADATTTGYEYCSIQELLHSYALLLQTSGMMKWADRIEWLFFNAGQGSRHPDEPSIAYLKSDNSYAMEGVFHCAQLHCNHSLQTRYKYSPTHQDTAVCCVPNAGRITPYYVQHMWMQCETGIIKTLYGPSKLHTEVNRVPVHIEEITEYPFEKTITYVVVVDRPCSFDILFRKPSWCERLDVVGEGLRIVEQCDVVVVHSLWSGRTRFEVHFVDHVRVHTDLLGDVYMSYGPLLFALPIESEQVQQRTYDTPGFKDTTYRPKQPVYSARAVPAHNERSFRLVENKHSAHLWKDRLRIDTKMVDLEKNKEEIVSLYPIGGTILRQVTFPTLCE